MKKIFKSILAFILFLVILSILLFYEFGLFEPTTIIIVNQSNYPISDIVVSGNNFEEKIKQLEKSQQYKFTPKFSGESGLKIKFNSKDRTIEKDNLAYLERSGGYIVMLEVRENLEIISKAGSYGRINE